MRDMSNRAGGLQPYVVDVATDLADDSRDDSRAERFLRGERHTVASEEGIARNATRHGGKDA